MATQSTAQTPNQIASSQPTTSYSAPIYGGAATLQNVPPYMPGAVGKSVAPTSTTPASITKPTGTTQAPAVVSSSNATKVASTVQSNMNQKVASAASVAAAKQNMTTTYDAQGNMVKTGGVMDNGNTYQESYSPGSPGFIPNPATVKQNQQEQQQKQQQQQEQTNTQSLYNAATGTSAPTAAPTYNNPSSVQPPQGVDPTTPDGQIQWYNQNPTSFDQWAKDQNMTSENLSNIHYQAQVANEQTDIATIKDGLNQFMNGTYPLTPDQQAQLDAAKAQFDQTIATQKLVNQSYENGTRILGITSGRQEYAPYDALGQIQQAVNSGLQKVADLQSKEAEALATMRSAFETNNFTMVNSAYNTMLKIDADLVANFKGLHDDVVAANKDARDFAEKQSMDNWTKYVNQKDLDLKDASAKLDQMKFTEQQKVDAQNILHQQTQDKIAAAELKIKADTYNATYGFMANISSGAQSANFNPTDIPGVKKTLNNVYYFDPSGFSDKNQAQAAENVARKAGITVLSDKLDTESMTNLTGALDNLQTLQDMFNKLAPTGIPGDKLLSKGINAAEGVTSFLGLGTTDRMNLLTAYNSNRDQLFKQIYALAGGHPRINSTEIEAAANAMPKLDLTNMDTIKGGDEKLTLTRKYLYNAVEAIVPNANLPKSGDLIYNSTDELLKAHPDRTQQAADLAKQGFNDDDIRTILNY